MNADPTLGIRDRHFAKFRHSPRLGRQIDRSMGTMSPRHAPRGPRGPRSSRPLTKRAALLCFAIVACVVNLPSAFLGVATTPLLLAIGQDATLSKLAGRYCAHLTWGLLPYYLFIVAMKFMQTQRVLAPPVWIALGTVVGNIDSHTGCRDAGALTLPQIAAPNAGSKNPPPDSGAHPTQDLRGITNLNKIGGSPALTRTDLRNPASARPTT